MSPVYRDLLTEPSPGILHFGDTRMSLLDVEANFWALRRQLEALVGRRLTDAALQQAGVNGGVSFARVFVGPDVDDGAQALRDCVAAYQATGAGRLEMQVLEWPIGRALIQGTDTFEAWAMRRHGQKTDRPVCAYTSGVLVGFVNALSERRDVVCVKQACQAQGDAVCLFELLPADQAIDTPVIAFDPDPFLSQQLNLLEILFDHMPMGIAILDRDLALRRYNPTWAGFVDRYTPSTAGQVVPGAHFFDLVPGADVALGSVFEQVLDGQTVREEALRLESGGIVSCWDVVLTPLIEEGRAVGIVSVTTDATARQRAAKEIRRRNKELATLNAIAARVSRSLDLNQICNGALEELLRLDLLGSKAKAMLALLDEGTGHLSLVAHQGISDDHLLQLTSLSLENCWCGPAVRQAQTMISEACGAEALNRCCWPETAPHKEICLPLKVQDGVLGVLNVWLPRTRALTESDVDLLRLISDQVSFAIQNAQLLEAVKQQNDQLRVLSARLAEAEEVERRQLARELHDQVGQNLTALGINLNIIRAQVTGTSPVKDAPDDLLGTRLDDSLALIEQTTERIRDVMASLRPPVLDDYGLVATLKWYAARFASRTDIDVTVGGEEPVPRLDPRVENALFRITQEALTNVSKHARATSVAVTLEAREENVRLCIADDGIGFDPVHLGRVDERQGWGLLTMAERAEAVGGRCRVTSRPEQGTQVLVEVGR